MALADHRVTMSYQNFLTCEYCSFLAHESKELVFHVKVEHKKKKDYPYKDSFCVIAKEK